MGTRICLLEGLLPVHVAKRCIFEYGHQAWLKILIHQSTVVNDFPSFQLGPAGPADPGSIISTPAGAPETSKQHLLHALKSVP